MSDDQTLLDSPEKIAGVGERLYAEQHKADLEKTCLGHFVAIDVLTGKAYVAEFPEQALEEARTEAPNGVLHLIRIGAPATFKVSYGVHRHGFWTRAPRPTR